ncbi:MAG: oligosaccharide flippase family protein [Clostridia bacterium]|nr:oligosaccharide flippase family protein [Clostridia bacterium]
MNVYQKLLSNTLLIALSTFGSKLLVFFLTPFYTAMLSPEEYGIMDNVVQLSNLLIPIASAGIANAVIRFGLDGVTDKKSVYTFGIVITALGSALLLASYPLLDLIPYTGGYTILVCFYVIASNFHAACAQFSRSCGNVRLYAEGGILCTAVAIGLNILFLAVFHWGVAGYVLSSILADVTCSFFYIIRDKQWNAFDLSAIRGKDRLKTDWEMLRYAIPLIPTTVCSWIINMSDRFIITELLGESANGIYSVANKVPTMLIVVSNIFTYAWQISAFADQPKEERNRLFSNVARVYQAVAFVGAAGLTVTAKISTILLADEAYYEAWQYVPMLVLATTFCCLANFLTSVYMVDKRSVATFLTILIGAVLNIAGNFILIPVMGPMGAALSTAVSYFVMFLTRAIHSRSSVAISWDLPRFIASTVLVTALTAVMILEVPGWIWISLGLTAVILVLNLKNLVKAVLSLLKKRKAHEA